MADGQADPPDLIAVPVQAGELEQGRPELDPFLAAGSAAVIAAADLTGKAGEVAEAAVRLGGRDSRVAFLGIGDGSPRALRRAGAELGRRAAAADAARGKTVRTPAIAGLSPEAAQAFVQGMLLGSYTFSLKSAVARERGAEVGLLTEQPAGYSAAVSRAITIAGAVALARDLINTPSARKSPAWLADEAARLAGPACSGRGSGPRGTWPRPASAASWRSGRDRRGRPG